MQTEPYRSLDENVHYEKKNTRGHFCLFCATQCTAESVAFAGGGSTNWRQNATSPSPASFFLMYLLRMLSFAPFVCGMLSPYVLPNLSFKTASHLRRKNTVRTSHFPPPERLIADLFQDASRIFNLDTTGVSSKNDTIGITFKRYILRSGSRDFKLPIRKKLDCITMMPVTCANREDGGCFA